MWNYAIHGTALGRENFLLSGDVMGDASARIEEQLGVPALFVNGAVGDVSPRQRGWDGVAAGGKTLSARGASPSGRGSRPTRTSAWPPTSVTALLPPAPASSCATAWGGGSRARHAPGPAGGAAVPRRGAAVVAVGGGAWVTIPGELGHAPRAGDQDRGPGALHARPSSPGVSNDYLGYFLAAEHFRTPSYIACGSLYGERGGELVRDAAICGPARDAGGAAREPAAGQAGALSLRASADFLRAAVLRWMTPLVTALSRARIASCTTVADVGALAGQRPRGPS